ncbi:cytochrome c biogenesis protein ResB [Singulisphaera rosea]
MATATRKNPSPAPRLPSATTGGSSLLGGLLRVADGLYRFFASLKLAVISLGMLAAVLAYATFFESWYGPSAVQEWIYQTKGFAILLAFLGMNILCAALIRFPWKRRQTGFVITHAGLLILLAGSFVSLKSSDEGQLGMLVKETKGELVRLDYPVIRVRPIDATTKMPVGDHEYKLPFRPGNFAWGPGSPRPRTIFASALNAVNPWSSDKAFDGEVLTGSDDPFVFKVKSHLPASMWTMSHKADSRGYPMAKIRPKVKPPNAREEMDLFPEESERWFTPTIDELPRYQRFLRWAKSRGPAQFAFMYVDRRELVDDFLNPPKGAGPDGVARLHYKDRTGKERIHDWNLEGQKDKTIELPDSDLSIKYDGNSELPTRELGLDRMLDEPGIMVANFKVRKGGGPEVLHHGWGSLPMAPNILPSASPDRPNVEPLLAINYFVPPELNPKTNGRFGLVEVLGTPDGSLYYRVFGRGAKGLGEIRSTPGPLDRGKEIVAFGGNPNLPMTVKFSVEEYLPAGREEQVCVPIVLAKGKQNEGIAASLVEMTVKGDGGTPNTKEFWIRRSHTLDQIPRRISFPTGDYEIVYDVDRSDLGFTLGLDKFKVEFDPGTENAASYTSNIRLNDPAVGIKDRPHTITMNEPLTHRGYTFYQSSYNRERDPVTDRPTGRFQSIFQVGNDPGRRTKYFGCLLVVLGAFVQFYMRAGLFSDGGKRERAVADAKLARKNAQANGEPPGSGVTIVNESDEPL